MAINKLLDIQVVYTSVSFVSFDSFDYLSL